MSCFKLTFAIFALSLVACDDTINTNCQNADVSLLISPASPVEFWPTNCNSHNDETVCGVHLEKWYAPWECDDEIKIPGTDLTTDDEYELAILNEDCEEIERIPFVQQELVYPQQTEDLEDFENIGVFISPTSWSIDASPSVSLPIVTGSNFTKILAPPSEFTLEVGKIYRFNVNATVDSETFALRVAVTDANDIIIESAIIGSFAGAGTFDKSVDMVIPSGAVRYGFYINKFSVGSGPNIDMSISSHSVSQVVYSHLASFVPSDYDICDEKIKLKIYNVTGSPEEEIYHSDGLDIKEEHSCSKLIEYHHNSNISGIIYTEGSPELVLNLRVLATMRIQQFPQEDLAIELTTGVDKISGSITSQTLFEADYTPYYFHRKLIMIFEHYYVYMDTKYWKKVDKYEIVEGNRKIDLKMGEIFLTERDFTFRLNS